MSFKKPTSEQAYLKMAIYGPQGSGKTFTSLLFAEGLAKHMNKRVAYVDTERGTDFYIKEVKQRQVHPDAFKIDREDTRSIATVTKSVKELDPKEYGVIVIDSISHIWDSCQEAYPEEKKTSAGTIPFHAWVQIKKPYKDLLNWLLDSEFHMIICGRQKNVYSNEDDQLKKVGVDMRAENETAYEPHICIRMEPVKDQKNTAKSVYQAFVEKDRSGVLGGKIITNPNFHTIEPLLPLLGGTQAKMEDEDERIARDSELLLNKKKQQDKQAKSRDLFAKASSDITTTENLIELNAVADFIKKNKRYMVEEHMASLKQLFDHKRTSLVNETSKEI